MRPKDRMLGCPLCGTSILEIEPLECGMSRVYCLACGLTGPAGSFDGDAVDLWNQQVRHYHELIRHPHF